MLLKKKITDLLFINKFLFFTIISLLTISLFYLYGIGQQLQRGFETYWIKQLIWIGLGLGFFFLILIQFKLELLRDFSPLIYFLGLLSLISVLLFGIEINSAKSWLNLFGIKFQMAEIAKLTTLTLLSAFVSSSSSNFESIADFFRALFIFFIPLILVGLQPDLGTGLVFTFIFINSLLFSNIRLKVLFFFFLIAILLLPIIYFSLQKHQQARINVFIHPLIFPIALKYSNYLAKKNNLSEKFIKSLPSYRYPYRLVSLRINYKKGKIAQKDYLKKKSKIPTNRDFLLRESWQYYQSLLAIGSGGLNGKGWQNGVQYSLGYIPLGISMTDCIFPVIAEEGGFFMLFFILTLYFLLILSIVRTAYKTRNQFGKLLCLNIASMFLIHIVINVGMSLGLVPIIGISLPFLSYGGSFTITCLMSLAFVSLVEIDYKKSLVKFKNSWKIKNF